MIPFLFGLMLVLARVAEGYAPGSCCQYCKDRDARNDEAYCDDAYKQHFTCRPGVQCIPYERSHGYDYYRAFGGCGYCPVGFFWQLCACAPCRSEGFCDLSHYYLKTVCANGYDMECEYCRTCGIGTYSDGGCNTGTRTQNRVCTECPAGTFRSSLDVQSCTTCKTCNLGGRERRTACNREYDRTCVTCGFGQIVTGGDLDICETCGEGTYARAEDNTCATCQSCPQTHRIDVDCQSTGDRTCTPCLGNKMALALSSANCLGCEEHYIKAQTIDFQCVLSTAANAGCAAGKYFKPKYSLTQGGYHECISCQGQQEGAGDTTLVCLNGQGVSARCDGGSTDVKCAACAAGTARNALTGLQDKIQACLKCTIGTYAGSSGMSACVACGNKPAGSEYIEWGVSQPATAEVDCPW